jgi:phage/plasmid primase-like uncharacterized protein
MALDQFLVAKNFAAAVGTPLDGNFYRFDRNGSLNGWFRGRAQEFNGKPYVLAVFGDWRTGETHTFKDALDDLSPEEQKLINDQMDLTAAQEREDRAKLHEETARICQGKWEEAITRGRTPYMERKQLASLYGAKICPDYPDTLLIPARDVDGKLWGIQRILPAKLDNGLDKLFTKGMRIDGCHHTLGTIAPEGTIYVCEGYATGASIHQATGSPTVCAFNAGNLASVANALRSHYPKAQIVLCADDDRWTQRPDGTPWNPGREKAMAAAKGCGGEIRLPVFSSLDTRPTDFNDLHILDGIRFVKQALLSPPSPSQALVAAPRGCEGLEPLEWSVSKRGAAIPPDHQKVADALVQFYGNRIVCQKEDIFIYNNTHWEHLTPDMASLIRSQLQFLYSDKGTSSQVQSFFSLFLTRLPKAPVDMFTPDCTKVNFLDGTLHLARRAGDYSKWTQDFRPHNPSDYVTRVLPLEYRKARNADGTWRVNQEWEAMLERVFQGDPDKAQKIRSVRQMYGACLAPLKPHFFLLHGPGGSGKSSLIIPAMRLVHQDNWCSVQPHEFTGFLMASMVGKSVNFCTDLSITKPIADDTIKMVEDRVRVRIDRKYQEEIYAPLPALHVWAANGIPPTQDGSSGAHQRRWTFIGLSAHKTVQGEYMHDFGNWVFDQDPHGILAGALQGLEDLLEGRGHYAVPDSGVATMEKWSLNNDPIGRFVDEAKKGNITHLNGRLMVHDEARILPGQLWECYKTFALDSFGHMHGVKKFQFYDRIEDLGFRRQKSGVIRFQGIGAIEES